MRLLMALIVFFMLFGVMAPSLVHAEDPVTIDLTTQEGIAGSTAVSWESTIAFTNSSDSPFGLSGELEFVSPEAGQDCSYEHPVIQGGKQKGTCVSGKSGTFEVRYTVLDYHVSKNFSVTFASSGSDESPDLPEGVQYRVDMSEHPINMTLAMDGWGSNGFLRNAATNQDIQNQSGMNYEFSVEDESIATITERNNHCIGTVQSPCPYMHVVLEPKKAGKTKLNLTVKYGSTVLGSNSAPITVTDPNAPVATPTPTAKPSSNTSSGSSNSNSGSTGSNGSQNSGGSSSPNNTGSTPKPSTAPKLSPSPSPKPLDSDASATFSAQESTESAFVERSGDEGSSAQVTTAAGAPPAQWKTLLGGKFSYFVFLPVQAAAESVPTVSVVSKLVGMLFIWR